VPLLSLTSKAEEKIAREILSIASEYVFALLCDEAKTKEVILLLKFRKMQRKK